MVELKMILDQLMNLFLSFCTPAIVGLTTIIFYIFLDRKTSLQALYFLMFMMIFNFALKVTFRIPFPSHVTAINDFAFPSGHMSGAMAFYGWLLIHVYNRSAKTLLFVILVGIALSIARDGFHYNSDIIGSIFFTGLTMTGYRYLIKNYKSVLITSLLALSTLAMVYISVAVEVIPHHVYMPYPILLVAALIEQKELFFSRIFSFQFRLPSLMPSFIKQEPNYTINNTNDLSF